VPGNYEVTLSKSGFTSQKRNVRVVAGRSVGLGADLVAEVPAKLTVTSTPPGAEITLNGDDTGKVTPATFSLGKGEHKVELHKSGFDDIAVTARVKEGENHTIAPVLQAEKPGSGNPFRAFRGLFGNRIPEGKGMISLESNPAGADVYQNGKKSPKGTPLKWPMDPGTYRITLRMDGYKAANREITVVKGKTTDVNVQLERR
jgi:uncharacterized membrane protein